MKGIFDGNITHLEFIERVFNNASSLLSYEQIFQVAWPKVHHGLLNMRIIR